MSNSTRRGPLWIAAVSVSALLVMLLLGLPTASDPGPGAALRVQLDPETGEIIPVTGLDKAELDRQMRQNLNRSAAGLTETRHADGGVSVDLAGRFQSLSVATTDSAGGVHTRCVTNVQELEQFMNDAPIPSAHDGERQ